MSINSMSFRPMSFKPPHFAGEKLKMAIPDPKAAAAFEKACIKTGTTFGVTSAFVLSRAVDHARQQGVNINSEQAEELTREVLSDHFIQNKTPRDKISDGIKEIIPQGVLDTLPAKFVSKRERETPNPFSSAPDAKRSKASPQTLVGLGINLGPSEALTKFYEYSALKPKLTGRQVVSAYQQRKDLPSLNEMEKNAAIRYHEQQRAVAASKR
jgi:hypothetical protein